MRSTCATWRGELDQVLVSLDGGTEPVWSRDGRELFYRETKSGDPYLVAAGIGTSPTLAVTSRKRLFPIGDIVGDEPPRQLRRLSRREGVRHGAPEPRGADHGDPEPAGAGAPAAGRARGVTVASVTLSAAKGAMPGMVPFTALRVTRTSQNPQSLDPPYSRHPEPSQRPAGLSLYLRF